METRPKSEGDLQESSGKSSRGVLLATANDGETEAESARTAEGRGEKSNLVGSRGAGLTGKRSFENVSGRN